MPTFITKFECGHSESAQVGVDRQPVCRDNEPGLCFWCDERRREIDRAELFAAEGN